MSKVYSEDYSDDQVYTGIDPRPLFEVTNIEREGQQNFDAKIGSAADMALTRKVDHETMAMFRKYGIDLPLRLAKRTWAHTPVLDRRPIV